LQPPLGIDEAKPGPASLGLQRSALRAIAALADVPSAMEDTTFAEVYKFATAGDAELAKMWQGLAGGAQAS
jgi:hypothetical protein